MENRIKPEDVLAAYKATGVLCMQNSYVGLRGGKRAACGMGALYIFEHPNISENMVGPTGMWCSSWCLKKWGKSYMLGFGDGFDDADRSMENIESEVQYTMGYCDGRASRKLILEEGLTFQ